MGTKIVRFGHFRVFSWFLPIQPLLKALQATSQQVDTLSEVLYAILRGFSVFVDDCTTHCQKSVRIDSVASEGYISGTSPTTIKKGTTMQAIKNMFGSFWRFVIGLIIALILISSGLFIPALAVMVLIWVINKFRQSGGISGFRWFVIIAFCLIVVLPLL